MYRSIISLLLLTTFFACDDGGDNPPPPPPLLDVNLSISPTEGISYGDFEIEISADEPIFFAKDAEDIVAKVGDIRLIFLEVVDDFTIRGLSQGHPAPNNENTLPFLVDIFLELPEGNAKSSLSFRYLPPQNPIFNKVYAVGASFTAGIQSNSLNFEGQRNGPVAAVAKQIGTFFSQPIAAGKGLPARPELADVDKKQGELEISTEEAIASISEAVSAGNGTFRKARADDTLFPRNLAVPGGGGRHVLLGTSPFASADPNDIGIFFFELFIQKPEEDVFGSLGDPFSANLTPPIEILEADPPTAILASVDFFANDVLGGDDVPTENIREEIGALFERIAALPTRPPFFTLSLIDVNIVPLASFRQDERYEILRANQALLDAAEEVNQALIAEGLPPRIFVGDFFSPFFALTEASVGEEIDIAGLQGTIALGANGENDLLVLDADGDIQRIGFDLFEGLISFDGLHLTNTGYAVLANAMIDHINRSIGPEAEDARNRLLQNPIPFINIGKILAKDPLSPKNLELERQALNAKNPKDPFPTFSFFADESGIPPLAPWDRCAVTFGPFQADLDDSCPAELILTASSKTVAPKEQVTVQAEVLDQNGQRMAGLPVSFFIDEDDDTTGNVEGEEGVFTNLQGQAQTTYTGGNGVGAVRIQAQAGGVVSFFEIVLGSSELK